MRTLLALLACATFAAGGTEPKAAARDYPAHAAAGACSLGAEFFARTIPIPGGGYASGAYIVVEVALFPAKGEEMMVRASEIRLRLNGAQRELEPQTPGIVASALKFPDAEGRRGLDAMVGVGPVILGPRQDRTPRFPGDPRGIPPPQAPRAPEPEKPYRSPPPLTDYEAVERFALQEGETETAVSGLLYYGWRDKLREIKRIELAWLSPCGRITVKLK